MGQLNLTFAEIRQVLIQLHEKKKSSNKLNAPQRRLIYLT